MNKLNELKNILYNYVKEYNNIEKEKEKLLLNKSIYEQLLTELSKGIIGDFSETLNISICLEILFGNKYDELQNCIFSCKRMCSLNKTDTDEYRNLIKKIITITNEIKKMYEKNLNDIEQLNTTIEKNKQQMFVCKRILSNFKYKQLIFSEDISNLDTFLKNLNYNNTELAEFMEHIYMHNKELISKRKGEKISFEEKNMFLNLFNLGWEYLELPEIPNKLKLKNYAESIHGLIEELGIDELKANIDILLPKISIDVKDELEYIFIIKQVMINLRNILFEKIELIKEPEFIMDSEIKNELADECFDIIQKYNILRDKLDFVEEKTEDEIYGENIENNSDLNNIFFLNNPNGKCYLLSDIQKMHPEYLEKVVGLFDDFKNNTITKKKNKKLTSELVGKGFCELKGDQIRIIYKNIGDNNYLIYGAFIKKDDIKFKNKLLQICNREGQISDDSEHIENEIYSYIETHSRKWSR